MAVIYFDLKRPDLLKRCQSNHEVLLNSKRKIPGCQTLINTMPITFEGRESGTWFFVWVVDIPPMNTWGSFQS